MCDGAAAPRSCDTLVYVGGEVGPQCTIFGKNSDRPAEEEHEVVFIPGQHHLPGSKVRCTYIEIEQAAQTLAVVLSRPIWLWGCEMGANERGVVGGNEAVHSVLSGELGSEKRLLGMDLLRLALERGETARDAAQICCELLECHGQGGGCAEGDDWSYENGYIFADAVEAWVVETAGVSHWAREWVGPGKHRNISNGLSIRTDVAATSPGLKELCVARGWWDGVEPFDWKRALSGGSSTAHANLTISGRERAGHEHLLAMAADAHAGTLDAADCAAWVRRMMAVLRDETSGICFRDVHGFCSTGSQISWLPSHRHAPADGSADAAASAAPTAAHLYTAASDPKVVPYKRFVFDSDGAAEPQPNRSLELWRRWRGVALKGGLADWKGRTAEETSREDGTKMECEAVQACASASSDALDFAAQVERELEMLVRLGVTRGWTL